MGCDAVADLVAGVPKAAGLPAPATLPAWRWEVHAPRVPAATAMCPMWSTDPFLDSSTPACGASPR